MEAFEEGETDLPVLGVDASLSAVKSHNQEESYENWGALHENELYKIEIGLGPPLGSDRNGQHHLVRERIEWEQ